MRSFRERPWRAEQLAGRRSSVGSLAQVLSDLTRAKYTNLRREPDANTADGRDVYVLAADVAVADLNDAPPDVAVPPGSKAVIDSQHLTVTIDKATWLLATERIDLSFHIGSTAGNETLATTFSDLNQPVHFPSDMPASCSNTTT